MKIVMHCEATFPPLDSMGAERMVYAVTEGLIELGHEVVMWLNPDSDQSKMPAPLITSLPEKFDIIHANGAFYTEFGKKYISVIHGGGSDPPNSPWHNNPHSVCVSDFICKLSNNSAYVHACVNPKDFIYKDKKQDYFAWIAGLDWGLDQKGLLTAIRVAKKMKIKLKIAGAGKNQEIINAVKSLCDDKIEFVGAVNGKEKAEFLSNAKALLFYTKLQDACPLVVSEAMISGTPIIGSTNGALPEIIPPQCGILCKSEQDIPKAVASISKIKPQNCREYAIKHYSHVEAAKKYLHYYQNVLEYGDVKGKQQ